MKKSDVAHVISIAFGAIGGYNLSDNLVRGLVLIVIGLLFMIISMLLVNKGK